MIDDQKHPFIVILGWGSLIWDPRELPTLGEWQSDGPVLPIEFSRISSGNRLTLVIDPEKGAKVPTRYIRSPRTKLEDAVADLLRREGMNSDDGIGIVDRSRGQATGRLPAIVKTIEQWAMQHDIDAVIWTDLPSNFQERSGHEFTPEAAAAHLQSLTGDHLRRAKEYINNAPTEIDTAARRFVANAGLL